MRIHFFDTVNINNSRRVKLTGCCLLLCIVLLTEFVAVAKATTTTSTTTSKDEKIIRQRNTNNNNDRYSSIRLDSLTMDYLDSPLGIDKAIPRVSWKLLNDAVVNDDHHNEIKKKFFETASLVMNDNNNNDDNFDASAPDTHSLSLRVRRNVFQKKYQLHVSLPMCPSCSKEEEEYYNNGGWIDCGWVLSNQTHLVPFQCPGVTPLSSKSDTIVSWKVSVMLDDDENKNPVIESDVTHFRTGLFGDWKAKWITGGRVQGSDKERTLLRKRFSLNRPKVKNSGDQYYATLFVSGIGYNHVFLNGVKVGDHQLDPGWTNYVKRVWYSTYDVTDMLHFDENETSNNVITIMLGNGWWSCGPSPGTTQPHCTNNPTQLILQLNVNGRAVLISDGSFRASEDSPIVYNSIYNGEVYDSRIAEDRIKGWNTLNYDDSNWTHSHIAHSDASVAILSSQSFEPIRHISTRPPISIVVSGKGENLTQVIDFGQNQAAVVRLKHFVCSRGTEIKLRHAELVMHPPYGKSYDNSTIYVDNLRAAKATDRYICNGNPDGESYTPMFTYHGFRYAELTGLNYTIDAKDIEAIELHSDVKQTSYINFADPILNKIQHMVLWGLKTNLMSVQTDCDQRDERLGWMGDAALTAEAAVLSYGMGAFYTQWLTQMIDAQYQMDGSMPDYVPQLGSSDGAPNWQTAYPIILWAMMMHYGDKDLISHHHDSLKKYFDFLEVNYNNTGIKNFRTGFGDWVPPKANPKSDPHFMGAFAFLGDLKLGIDLFKHSPHPEAESQLNRLTALFGEVSPEFHHAFFNQTSGVYMSGLQTEQALPLYLGIVPEDLKSSILSYLVNDIEVTNNVHTTSGIVGIKLAMEVLSELDRGDVALDLALQTSYPSWGYMINSQYEPATTVWELWESDTAGPGMNSRNHHMYGTITSWFYKYVAGIMPLDPGFSRIQIRPNLLRHDNFTAKVVSPYGDIHLNYLKQGNVNGNDWNSIIFVYEVILPPGTSGSLQIPVAVHDKEKVESANEHSVEISIQESDNPVWSDWQFVHGVRGVLNAVKSGKRIHVDLSNGRYLFKVTASNSFKSIS